MMRRLRACIESHAPLTCVALLTISTVSSRNANALTHESVD